MPHSFMDWNQFNDKLMALGYAQQDRSFIEKAFHFARQAHEGQTRASGEPYFSHAVAAADTIADMRMDAKTIAAALLHDTMEDCDVSHDTLAGAFGSDTAFLVEGVSKLGTVRYRGVQRKVESLRKMFLAVAEDVRVVLIKLADRLHNMQTIHHVRPDKQKRIAVETLEIYAPIAYRLGMGSLKGRLEDLAFPIVHPPEYAWVRRESNRRVPEGEQYLRGRVKPAVEEALKAEGVHPLFIDVRKKHLYSLWKKLLRYDMDFARMSDLLAVRIVVKTIEDCYQTLGIIHQLWKPLPGRIKDYIALPKHNGYRSIHTTVFCVENKITEFQIRTQEMHEEAERGIAAHWMYAETGKPKHGSAVEHGMAWAQKLSDWHHEIGALHKGDDFLESLKIDFFNDRIFVLTPKGEVIDLPQGATPIDFAYAIHTDIGNRTMGAKINGKLAPFDRELESGQTIEILTQKNRKPNAEWLSFVKTSLAKNRIRAAVRDSVMEPSSPIGSMLRIKAPYQFTVTAHNRVGLLKDITAVFSAYRIHIRHVSINDKHRTHPDVVLSAELRDQKQAERITTRLKNIRGVEAVGLKQ